MRRMGCYCWVHKCDLIMDHWNSKDSKKKFSQLLSQRDNWKAWVLMVIIEGRFAGKHVFLSEFDSREYKYYVCLLFWNSLISWSFNRFKSDKCREKGHYFCEVVIEKRHITRYYSLPLKKEYTFNDPSTQNKGGREGVDATLANIFGDFSIINLPSIHLRKLCIWWDWLTLMNLVNSRITWHIGLYKIQFPENMVRSS